MPQEESEKEPENNDYEIGYCKPPKKSQFKKGQSGNPSGKKKGGKLWQEGFQDLLFEPLTVRVNGSPKCITMLEAMMRAQIARAFKNERAFAQIMGLFKEVEARSDSELCGGGVLVVPAQMSVEDWKKAAEAQQAPFRDGSFYRKNNI